MGILPVLPSEQILVLLYFIRFHQFVVELNQIYTKYFPAKIGEYKFKYYYRKFRLLL